MRHALRTTILLLAILPVLIIAACGDDPDTGGPTTGTGGNSGTSGASGSSETSGTTGTTGTSGTTGTTGTTGITGDAGTVWPITVMFWNVLNFESTGAFLNIAAEVSNRQVDILVVSEIQNNDGDQANFTAALDAVGWPMPHSRLSSLSDGYNSIGVFSRHGIEWQLEILKPPGPRTIYQVFISLTNGRNLTLYGAHLKSGATVSDYNRRVSQAQALANHLRSWHNLRTDYVVVLGDMNTMGDGSGGNRDFATGGTLDYLRLLDDADPDNDFLAVNYTFLPEVPTHSWPSLLDHVLLSPAATARYIAGSVTVPATPWSGPVIYSDHRPVLVRLNMGGTNSVAVAGPPAAWISAACLGTNPAAAWADGADGWFEVRIGNAAALTGDWKISTGNYRYINTALVGSELGGWTLADGDVIRVHRSGYTGTTDSVKDDNDPGIWDFRAASSYVLMPTYGYIAIHDAAGSLLDILAYDTALNTPGYWLEGSLDNPLGVLSAAVGAGKWNGVARGDALQVADPAAMLLRLRNVEVDGNAAADWDTIY